MEESHSNLFMLGQNGRRILLTIHIFLNSLLFGGFVTLLFLNIMTRRLTDSEHFYAANLMLFRIHDLLISNVAFGVIITGLLFSLFTRWGFFDFYWVAVKWLLLIALFSLIMFSLTPAVNGLAAIADIARYKVADPSALQQLQQTITIYSVVIIAILAAMILISVFKSWGKRKKLFQLKRQAVIIIGIVVGLLTIWSALMQYWQLHTYRNLPIKNVNLYRLADGIYQGEANYGFQYRVQVMVQNHRIEAIKIMKNRQSYYAKLAEGISDKILFAQTLNVDAVTGATTTSKCLQKAIENAMIAPESSNRKTSNDTLSKVSNL